MTEDEPLSPVAPRETVGDARYAETLLYDFGKFLTSLSLIVLGGIISFAPATGLAQPGQRPALLLILGSVALAGICALSIVSRIVVDRAEDKAPPRYLKTLGRIATGALGLGVGAFMAAWAK